MPHKLVDWNGERLVPDLSPPAPLAEHLSRYEFAVQLVGESQKILDVACGAGYGSFMISQAALGEVVGVDIDSEAVEWAQSAYGSESSKLQFMTMDGNDMTFSRNSFDFITSFETLEHVETPGRFLDEVVRVLKPEGTFIVSVPDRLTNSDAGISNHFHYSEMDLQEFRAQLESRFEDCSYWVQTLFPCNPNPSSDARGFISSYIPSYFKAALKALLGKLWGGRTCFDGRDFQSFKNQYGELLDFASISVIDNPTIWIRDPKERYAFLAVCRKGSCENGI